MILFHNPRCSSSRDALDILNKNGCHVEIREYLVKPPTQKELKELLKKLGIKAIDLVRKKEPLYQEKFAAQKINNAEWIRILSKNPVLIERPILIQGDKAIIGRPPALVIELIK